MKKLLAQLLKNNYTKRDVLDQLRLITPDIKAKTQDHPEEKGSLGGKNLITPDTIDKLPVATITLAIPLTPKEVQSLGQWFRRHLHPQTLLKVTKDPQIIGGCRIIWKGFEGDFSLRKKFRND